MTATLVGYARCSPDEHRLATFAEFDMDLVRMRTRERMAVARAKGKVKGKRPNLSVPQQSHLLRQHRFGEHTIADLAELFSISRATVYRVLERQETTVSASIRTEQ
ncbi:helix-turn-helix domain-containing protein [Nocardia sp. NPDC052112]|uniref:helix-turn-helix domain-containing protein n=1 Tax=Nocardia sp. NPDC052112 TaxID=3155646 RepID=UPI00341D131D